MKDNREYRAMDYTIEKREGTSEPSFLVRGYASTFEPYTLFEEDGIAYKEQIDPEAFDGADMSDVVFRVDHEGTVYARTSNNSIELYTDEHGLGHKTDLSLTEKARGLFDDIRAGMYPKMSFAFTVEDDEYDKKTHTRIIHRIAKVFDISPVSFPANPGTELSVSTRSFFDGAIKEEKAERLECEKRLALAKARYAYETITK